MPEDHDNFSSIKDHQAPVWARSDAFPRKPSDSSKSGVSCVYGFTDVKGNEYHAGTADELREKVGKSKHSIDMVWGPESEYLLAPEEITELRPKLWERRSKWAQHDIEDGRRVCLVFGVIMLWFLVSTYQATGNALLALQNPGVGVAGILMLILGLVPLYEGWKVLRKGKPSSEADWAGEVDESRFDSWLGKQNTPVTYSLLAVLVVTGLAQLYLERGMSWTGLSLSKVGLLKNDLGSIGGEWWRFLTAPLVHGNLLHWLMNAAAFRYLGGRVESLARWPHVVIVTVFAAAVGGFFSYAMVDAPSVGASGGIMGLLGFLLVFEVLHSRLVPKPTRRRLIAGVVVTAVMGLLGFKFIDNAAHLGGLVAGMVYAAAIFPPSKSPQRPRIMNQDRLITLLAGVVVAVGLVIVLIKLF